jgi:hypothetical protein
LIVLNTTKELVKIESWDDIELRPGFTKNLDPNAHSLEAIIGRYVFSEKIPCGLSTCHKPHAKGYIVATKDGQETNIGKDCGKTYFGVDFETLSRKFDRDFAEKENREKLWSFKFGIEELKQRIHNLRTSDYGANWVYSLIIQLQKTGKNVPTEIVHRISSMVKAREPVLYIERNATTEEINSLEAAQDRRLPRPYYIQEPIAEIEGLDALFPENDLRKVLVIELQERIKQFEEKDIDSLNFESLRIWAKWIGAIDTTIEHALASIESGRRLLRADNLEPFLRILHDAQDLNIFRRYLKEIKL